MDFFSSQDRARRKTGRLILLFSAAVLSLIVITNVLVMAVFGLTDSTGVYTESFWSMFLGISAVIIAVILLGSLYKMSALAGGGARVAEMMSGRLLVPGSGDFHERRVLNVVEEMALASGTPVPPVYLLEEEGINAFAAGYAPEDAVIGVTRGAIRTLSRDELQGVIAHEFSHILNGDMRMNIRLIATLHGILILGIIGRVLLRSGSRGRRSKEGGGIVFLGLGLLVIGYTGIFFGNLIKAAVSRQREFLADASSVQFTRNPEGIGHALMRIATHSQRSYLGNPKTEEISHALFEEGSRSMLSGLFATHPPLEKRIQAVMPGWNGDFALPPVPADDEGEEKRKPVTQSDKARSIFTGVTGVLITDALIKDAGRPDADKVDTARQLLHEMPPALLLAAREPAGARAVIYLSVLDRQPAIRQLQLDALQKHADAGVYDEVLKHLEATGSMAVRLRLPLISIALGTLRQLTRQQYRLFRDNLDKLIAADKKISPFEWALQKIVGRQLDAVFEKKSRPHFGKLELSELHDETAILLSFLALAGNRTEEGARLAFNAAISKLGNATLKLSVPHDIDYAKLNRAMDRVAQLKPLQKPMLLKACAAGISGDGEATPEEVELFRAIADTLDCPLPPLGSR